MFCFNWEKDFFCDFVYGFYEAENSAMLRKYRVTGEPPKGRQAVCVNKLAKLTQRTAMQSFLSEKEK